MTIKWKIPCQKDFKKAEVIKEALVCMVFDNQDLWNQPKEMYSGDKMVSFLNSSSRRNPKRSNHFLNFHEASYKICVANLHLMNWVRCLQVKLLLRKISIFFPRPVNEFKILLPICFLQAQWWSVGVQSGGGKQHKSQCQVHFWARPRLKSRWRHEPTLRTVHYQISVGIKSDCSSNLL